MAGTYRSVGRGRPEGVGTSYRISSRQICDAINIFTEVYDEVHNKDCTPFKWIKTKVRQVSLTQYYTDKC